MSDIVSKLRIENRRLKEEHLECARLATILTDSLRARVEELERLNRELAEGDALRDEIARYRAGLQKIVEGDGFWDAPSLARDLLAGKDVT
jgi:cell division protein FtsB